MPPTLPDGLYESLVTQALEQAIAEAQRAGRSVHLDALDAVECDTLLIRHLAAERRPRP